jgi:hypothetical protein
MEDDNDYKRAWRREFSRDIDTIQQFETPDSPEEREARFLEFWAKLPEKAKRNYPYRW